MRLVGHLARTSRSTNPNLLTQVQRDVLQCFVGVSPPVDEGQEQEDLFLATFSVMVDVLTFIGGYDRVHQTNTTPKTKLFVFCEQMLLSTIQLSTTVSERVRTRALQTLVEGLGACLGLKYSHHSSQLWQDALPMFTRLLEITLPHLSTCTRTTHICYSNSN